MAVEQTPATSANTRGIIGLPFATTSLCENAAADPSRSSRSRSSCCIDIDTGVPELESWLKRWALQNEASGASRTYVISADGRVIGYYALATGAVAQQQATGRVRRNMPEPIPVMVIGRLAVDRGHQGTGLGAALSKDALMRTLNALQLPE
jgi:GNAT superfamily N-acetyltransferase